MTDGGTEEVDAGGPARDAGQSDDAGVTDAGTPDAGLISDAGAADAGTPNADAGSSDAGSTDAGALDAGIICTANVDTLPCYDGAAGTLGVGLCVGGTKTCASDGRSYGTCTGQVVPVAENCGTRADENCDGTVNEASSGCVCSPGSVTQCYSGATGTSGVGPCHGGTALCNAAGTGYDACMNEVVPSSDLCGDNIDQDCDGRADEFCSATYATNVQPIFFAKCAPCHTGLLSGGHNMGTTYADTQLASYYCPGLTKGACTIVRIHDGSMPAGLGCNTTTSPGCVSAGDQEIIEGWVNGGLKP
jgi:hypothetical protein